MIVLGLETSCDETGIAIYNTITGILYEYTYVQNVHSLYGGVVPNLASKEHFKKILKLVILTLKNKHLTFNDINFVSYTIGPGLKSSLLVGVLVGKIISFSLNIPSVGINHLKSHISLSFLFYKYIKMPCLVLFLSGAHTFILEMIQFNEFNVKGRTLDDSLGETFDKIARALKLIPSSGKMIEICSQKKKNFKNTNYPKIHCNSLDFSFSGIKSAVIRDIKKNILSKEDVCNISYNFQNTVFKVILDKIITLFFSKKYKIFIFSGGVSANKEFRLALANYAYFFNIVFCIQPIKYCTDNGVMVAFLGFINFSNNFFDKNFDIVIKPNLELE